jgi:chemotaxis protein CheX
MSNMLGEEYTEINEENKDGVAELCNQIYGNGRISLNEKGFGLGSAIPTVIYGENHKISHAAQGPILASYFKTEYGRFVIECVLVAK